MGLRAKEYDQKPGAYRIFCLGDSMTFGYGVEAQETYASLLSRDLGRILGRKIESINGGISGYDVDRYPLVLEYIGLKYHPNLVIVFFTISNDFGVIVKEGVLSGESAKKDSFSIRRMFINIKEYLFRHSHFYAWIKRRLDGLSPLNGMLVRLGLRDIGDIYLKDYPPSMELKVMRAKNALEEIKNMGVANNFNVIVIAIPDAIQIAKNIKMDSRYWDMEKPNRALEGIAGSLGLEYLDLLPLFKSEDSEKFYYKKDGHLNKLGHEEVAEIVSGYLAAKNLIR